MQSISDLRMQARSIWQAGVDAVLPEKLVAAALSDRALGIAQAITQAPRILVVGGGKAGAGMSAALETALAKHVSRIEGIVNVPESCVRPLQSIRLHAARPAGSNEPTTAGVTGAECMLELVSRAGPEDVAICLLSGGGSALMPAPVQGVSLADKQKVTRGLHACGATIQEMNTVRKHLSRIKGGQLAAAFRGKTLWSLIISDVIGDPLDVIASGPTVNDPTTFADALAVFRKYGLSTPEIPASVLDYLELGFAGKKPETPKQIAPAVRNFVLGNNARALRAAQERAEQLGYRTVILDTPLEGETSAASQRLASCIERERAHPAPGKPCCILAGGETTVTLQPGHGLGGRNQDLALALALRKLSLAGTVILSAGTDGEDGPTDAAGAFVDQTTIARAGKAGLDPRLFRAEQNSYRFFAALDDLFIPGLTGTNVMDLCVVLTQ